MCGTLIKIAFPILVVSSNLLLGQVSTSEVQFEVASLKPSVPSPDGSRRVTKSGGGANSASPGQLSYRNVPIRELLADAYQLRLDQVIGPGWMDAQHIDLIAKVPSGATRADVRIMIQNLLIERLDLKLHHEKREMPVYLLRFGKFGPKLKPATAAEIAGVDSGIVLNEADRADGFPRAVPAGRMGSTIVQGICRWRGVAYRIDALIRQLTVLGIDRPVVNETGLNGRYDFTFEYTIETRAQGGRATQGLDAAEPNPTLIQALHDQLGFRVSATKAPLDMLVVDSGRRIPIGN